MGRKERRLRDQQELKQSMLEAARTIALAEGWSNVTMRKIADRIEYSHAAIYDYFENKDVLLLELVHEGFRLLEADLKRARAQAHDPEETMRLIARGYLDFAWRYPEFYRLMYGLDGVTFSVSEPEKEGLQIEDVAARTVKEVLDSHGWSTEHLADQVNILWGIVHGLVALTLAFSLIEASVASGQSHLIFGTGSPGCVPASQSSKPCCANTLYKRLETLDAIALSVA